MYILHQNNGVIDFIMQSKYNLGELQSVGTIPKPQNQEGRIARLKYNETDGTLYYDYKNIDDIPTEEKVDKLKAELSKNYIAQEDLKNLIENIPADVKETLSTSITIKEILNRHKQNELESEISTFEALNIITGGQA